MFSQIVTHNGKFHSDEIMAIAIVRSLFNNEIPVIRSRVITKEMLSDPSILVIDVGGSFNPSLSNFDHHQLGAPVRADGVPYSSAGLVWAESRELFSNYEWEAVDRMMRIIDISDNGAGPEIDMNRISMQEVLSSFNTTWVESENQDAAFEVAVSVAGLILNRWISQAKAAELSEQIVNEACEAHQYIIRLTRPMPWHDTFFKKERTHKFVMFQASPDDWRLQCIPPSMAESFKQRQPLPEQWAGLRGSDLEKVSGIEGATFCHKGLFICGAKTKEAIEQMAVLASWSTV
jgi:uncharacterized UPF0160 family protein